MSLKWVCAALFAALASSPASANDSTAELATGGLVFVKNDNIEMQSEDLFISARQIRVRYKFFNRSDKDIAVRVAFPVPDISAEDPDFNIAVPTDDPVDILGLRTVVSGKPVKVEVEQRVFAGGTEQTKFLRDLGIPLAPYLPSVGAALEKLPADKQAEIIARKLGDYDEYDDGKGMKKHLAARWTLKTAYHWEQTFPARAETLIEHTYQPSVGATSGTSIGGDFPSDQVADYTKKYCIDRDFLAAVAKAKKTTKIDYTPVPFTEERIEYILSTGANWSGPIRDFRLVVDKGSADNLITFCGDGVQKIAPTQFEMKKTNFTPKGNFAVLILKKITGN